MNLSFNDDGQNFPRKLSNLELKLLFFILPENRKGYAEFRKLLEDKFVIGYGRFGGTNLVLGEKNDKPDLSIPSAPVFAIGGINYSKGEHYILIHDDLDGLIEFDISYTGEFPYNENYPEEKKWTYSNWLPGENAPLDNSEVKEINVFGDELILVVALKQKRIWLYEKETQINHLIPITNFYNELMLVKHIQDPKIALKSDYLFHNFESFTENDFALAFLNYNKRRKKVKFDYEKIHNPVKEEVKGNWKKFFKRS